MMAMLRSPLTLLLLALAAASCGDDAAPGPDASVDAGLDAGSPEAAAPDMNAAAEVAPEPGNIVPSAHDFGPVRVGAESDPFPFRLSNTSSGPIAAPGVELVQRADGDFVVFENQCATSPSLAAGASCSISVRFKPATRGIKNGSLIVRGAGPAIAAPLTGKGEAPPELAILPMTATFTAAAGTPSGPVMFLVSNGGDAFTGPVSVVLGGPDIASFKLASNGCLAPLSRDGTCMVAVVLDAATPGPKTATLTASSPAGGLATATLMGSVN